jgi:hypothetical protein
MNGHSLLVIAQTDTSALGGAIPVWALILGLSLAGIALVVLVPTILGLRHARRTRELEHAERMRALELGHPLPGSQPYPPRSPAVLIGAWVPIAAFGVAFIASQSGGGHHEAWVAASIVGTAAVICGSILAIKCPVLADAAVPQGKPKVDPAAYEDLAERR